MFDSGEVETRVEQLTTTINDTLINGIEIPEGFSEIDINSILPYTEIEDAIDEINDDIYDFYDDLYEIDSERITSNEAVSASILNNTSATQANTSATVQRTSATQASTAANNQAVVSTEASSESVRHEAIANEIEAVSLLASSKAKNEDVVKSLLLIAKTEGLTKAKLKEISAMSIETLVSQGLTRERALEVKQVALAVKAELANTKATKALAVAQGLLTTAFITAIGVIAHLAVTYATDLAQAQEEARQKAVELSEAYEDEIDTLDEEIEKYKELKKAYMLANPESEEALSIKENLVSIQDDLIDSYGKEASKLDLVNGKYQEQLDLLQGISQEKTKDYLKENKSQYEEAQKTLEKESTYSIGYMLEDATNQEREDFREFLDSYDSIIVTTDVAIDNPDDNFLGNSTIVITANAEDAYEILSTLYDDIEKYGKENFIDVDSILTTISSKMGGVITDEISESRELVDSYLMAKIKVNEDYTKLYNDATTAVEEYNEALTSGNVSEAKENLEAVKEIVYDTIKETDDVKEVFDGIFDDVDIDAEDYYSSLLDQFAKIFSTGNEDIVSQIAEELSSDLGNIFDKAQNSSLPDQFSEMYKENILHQIAEDELSFDDLETILDNAKAFKAQYKMALSRDSLSSDEIGAVEDYNYAVKSCEEYIDTLDDLYKAYNGINNVDRDIIYWNDENLEKYSDFIESWFRSCGYDSAEAMAEELKGDWSTVLAFTDNIDGVEIAYTAMLQTDDGLLPLTQDEFWKYFNSIFNQAWNDDGTFNADKFIELDSQGADMLINGQMEHVANMIAAAEGQYMNGIKLTSDDVIAIGTPEYDSETGEALIPNINSIFKGFSMHEVQAQALETKEKLELVAEAGEESGRTVQEVFDKFDTSEYEKQLDAINTALAKINPEIETTVTLSTTDTVDKLVTNIQPAFDKIKSAWQEIFDDDEFDLVGADVLSICDDIKSELDDMAENGLTIDADAYEDFVKVLVNSSSTADEVKAAFNKLSAQIIEAGTNGTESFEVLKTALEDLGVVDNEIEALNILSTNYEALKEAGLDLAEATEEDIKKFVKLCGVADNASQAIALLTYRQRLLNVSKIDTSDEVAELITLAENSGLTEEAIEKLSEAELIYQYIEKNQEDLSSVRIDELKGQAQKLLKEISESTSSIDWTPTVKYPDTSSSSSSSSDSTKSYDWIETAIENIEDEYSRLDKIIDSSYSSWEEKNAAYAQQLGLINDEIQLYQQAYDEYMAKADSIALSDYYKDLVRNGAVSIEDITDSDLQDAISDYEEWYDKAKEIEDEITDLTEQSLDVRVNAYENAADELDSLRENNAITEREYLDRMTTLWEFFYENQVELAEVAKEKKIELLEEEKDYLESVASAASNILSKQIDALEEERDKITDGYQEQIDALEKERDALQDQLDALEEEEERESKILALQQAQYELARAENQRSNLVYKDGELVYDTDSSAISDARQSVKDAELDLLKYNIQSQIDAYDKQIDALNDLIDTTEEYYEKQIDALEKIQDEWEKVLDLYDDAVDMVNFKSMFGDGSIEKLLSGDLTMLDTFKQAYTDNLAEIDVTTNGVIGDITKQYSALASTDLSGVSEQAKSVASKFDALNDAVNTVSDTMNETIPVETDMMNELNDTTLIATENVNGLQTAIEGLPTEKTVTIKIETQGNASLLGTANVSGTAHVEGTAKAQGDWGAKVGGKSLVGELGREMVVSGSRFYTVGENGAEFVDIKPGDIVFNHRQTEELLKNGHISTRGRAYANGTVSDYTPLMPGTENYELMKKFDAMLEKGTKDWDNLVFKQVNVFDDLNKMLNSTPTVTNNGNTQGVVINGGISITCPGVTSKEVAEQISNELEKAVFGLSMKAYQRANITR